MPSRPHLRLDGLSVIIALSLILCPSRASAERVRVTNLSNVNFGLISNLQVESRRSQNVCVYANSSRSSYSVYAYGSAPGSAFALTNGSHSLAYGVQWSGIGGQTSGVALAPNVVLAGQTTVAQHQTCSNGPTTSASLSIVLPASELSQAREGTYSGSLTLVIAAE